MTPLPPLFIAASSLPPTDGCKLLLLQLTVVGFKTLGQGCTELQTVMLNDIFTLDDGCIKVGVMTSRRVRDIATSCA